MKRQAIIPRRVVITGIGCLSPNGIGRENYAAALKAGRSGIRRITRFDPSDLPVQIAAEVVGLDVYEIVPPKERQHLPRVVPMALWASEEALQDAGLVPDDLTLEERRRIGVVVGSGGGGLEFAERQYGYYYAGEPKKASVYTIASTTLGTLSSEISMRFRFRGLSHVISTGCASSTDAVAYAAEHIQLGRADMILTGGVDAPISHGIMWAFCNMRAMTPSWNHAPERASRPFSRDRDGFVLGEGAWMFVLEDLDHAKRRGAKIYAEILGYGATCDAYHRVRLDESGEEPARAMRLAIEDAGVAPSEIDYLNLHGTSTVLNDRIETRAVKLAFGERASRIPMSATKSMIGHAQGACGAAGLAATLLGMRDGFLPPTINLDEPDPECDLDYVPHESRPAEVRTALCNCISFGSKNAALVVRRYDET
jgi:3-oxoacyl-[acyl-carrier-protein] synthase II